MNSGSPVDSGYDGSEIAVCGVACRFPGAPDVDTFWANLRDGIESISFFTDEQLLAAGEDPANLRKPNYVKARPVLEEVDLFDAAFFGFTPREAQMLDPQHRLFLECVWEALEHAGYDTERFDGSIGLFAGTSFSNYLVHNLYENRPIMEAFGDFETTICNVTDALTTKTAYKLNLKGACYSVQTFCSTSLVAVHLACQSLLNFESDLSIAGGVTINVPQEKGYFFQEGGIASSDGHCRSFDAKADGTVFGNGAGVVVLKRLEEAFADRDVIHAVIRGSATNNDGALKVSYAAPSVVGQTEVIVEALATAGVDADTISYVECPGTGTRLGDPVEITALTKAYRTQTNRKGFCAVGSVKTNVGHLDAAGGVAALIKTIWAIKHKQLPPSLHFESPNPGIDFESSPFYVNTQLTDWPVGDGPRRAGVSAFGIGGTNAHVILEAAPPLPPDSPSRSHQLLLISAQTPIALEQATRNLSAHLRKHSDVNLADVAHTLQTGRRNHAHRRVVVCENTNDALDALDSLDPKQVITACAERHQPPIVFLFPDFRADDKNPDAKPYGTLYETERACQEAVDVCIEACPANIRESLRAYFQPISSTPPSSPEPTDTANGVAHRALFTYEYALAKLWMSWGIKPSEMLGEGIGEFVAATLTGAMTLDDALAVIAERASAKSEAERQAIRPARAADNLATMESLIDDPDRVFLEVGPGSFLATQLRQHPKTDARRTILTSSGWEADQTAPDLASLLSALGELWLAGVPIDWPSYYANEHRRRIPLPTYPFQRERYWVEPLAAPDHQLDTAALLEKRSDVATWLYHPVWKSSVMPRRLDATQESGDLYLLLVDASGVGQAIADRLRRARREVITVSIGSAFDGDRVSGFTIDPTRPDDFIKLAQALADAPHVPIRIVHMWCADPARSHGERAEDFKRARDQGLTGVANLLHALRHHEERKIAEVCVVVTQSQDVLGDENVVPEQAMLNGLCRVGPYEYAETRFRSIDIEPDAPDLDILAAEIAGSGKGAIVAHRGRRRWVQVVESTPVNATTVAKPALRENGVYLITDGLQGIGFVLAAYLAKTVRAKLILTDTEPIPQGEERQPWLETHAPTDPTSILLRSIEALEKLGAEVMALTANPADADAMKAVAEESQERFGSIRGMIHAPAFGTDSARISIEQITPQDVDTHIAPIARSLRILDTLFPTHSVDFRITTATLAGVLGGPLRAIEAAADAYADALAHSCTRWTSINWDQWQSIAQSVAKETDASGSADAIITPQEAATVFHTILKMPDLPQAIVSTVNLHARAAFAREQIKSQAGAGAPTQHARPAAIESSYVAPQTPMEGTLALIWQNTLGIDRVGTHDNFFDLGGNSMMTVQMIGKVNEETGLSVKFVDFIFQTLGQIAAVYDQQKSRQLQVTKPDPKKKGLLSSVRSAMTRKK